MRKKKKIIVEEPPEIHKLRSENEVLTKNMIWLKEQAEKAGTEKNQYKHQLIRLQEKYDRLLMETKVNKK